ncbi:MAG: hypothetical protein HY300_16645 [Verrucomicrobia bacterium]|nr:hypothetical protein [Verrucomicrobiota bacterium]
MNLKPAVEVQTKEQILPRLRADFRQDQLDEERGAVDLLEVRLELRAEAEAHEPAQAHVLRRPGERFQMRRVNRDLADFLNVGGMAKSRERVAVEQLEDLRASAADTEQQNAIGQARGEHGRAVLELIAHVFAPVLDGLKPAIGFLSHSCLNFNSSKTPFASRR